jgi:hypothetical protein
MLSKKKTPQSPRSRHDDPTEQQKNRTRILCVLEKATTELLQEKQQQKQKQRRAAAEEVTFCLKRRTSPRSKSLLSYMKDHYSDSDLNLTSNFMNDESNSSRTNDDKKEVDSDAKTPSALASSVHNSAADRRDCLRKSLRSSRSLRNLNTSSLRDSYRQLAPASSRNNGKKDLNSDSTHSKKLPTSLSKASSSSMLLSSSSHHSKHSVPPTSSTRPTLMRCTSSTTKTRQQQQPLLPRQRSLRDIKVSKQKANARPSLVKQGSLTTRQSEFAALEALMGKKKALLAPMNQAKSRPPLTRSQSFDTLDLPMNQKRTSLLVEPAVTNTTKSVHPVSYTSPRPTLLRRLSSHGSQNSHPHRPRPTLTTSSLHSAPGNDNSSGRRRRHHPQHCPPVAHRRNMLLKALANKKQSNSTRNLMMNSTQSSSRHLALDDNANSHSIASSAKYVPSPLTTTSSSDSSTGSHKSTDAVATSTNPRGHMLRRGSFVAGSKMRTLRG